MVMLVQVYSSTSQSLVSQSRVAAQVVPVKVSKSKSQAQHRLAGDGGNRPRLKPTVRRLF